jgi:hypothetical protein
MKIIENNYFRLPSCAPPPPPAPDAQLRAAPGPHHPGEKKGLEVEDDGGVGMDIVSCARSPPSVSRSHGASPRDRLPRLLERERV